MEHSGVWNKYGTSMEQVWNRYGTDGTQTVIHTHQQTLIHTHHKFGAINKSPLASFTEAAN